ncbi:MAG: hypothetical protein JNM27_06540 [Leptospirales bacterium]|nr:hypothetical protein [Leptospirales bacterium]
MTPLKPQARPAQTTDLLRMAVSYLETGLPLPQRALASSRSCQEMLEILTDLACIEPEPRIPSFTIAGEALTSSSLGFGTLAPAFRSESPVAILHSDVFPLGADFLLVELSGNGQGWDLLLEKGSKKGSPVSISLYKGDNLVEFLLIKNRLRKSLDQLGPGNYRVLYEEKTLLNFSILDEDKDNNQRRSHYRQN